MGFAKNMTGLRFGKLLVLSRRDGKHKSRVVFWNCMCECGNSCVANGRSLRNGDKASCGCLRKEAQIKIHFIHGYANKTPEYRAWKAMRKRCYNPNYEHYKDYGGRGIKVCERWLSSFEDFLADMGQRPSSKHSLDRYPNINGDYEPANCRWGTSLEQARNKRNNVWINFNGENIIITEFAKRIKAPVGNVCGMYRRGKSLDQIKQYYSSQLQ